MEVLYSSENIYHHMVPFSKAIINKIGEDNFKYAVLKPPAVFRIRMGFDTNYEDEKWIIRTYLNKQYFSEFKKWFDNADIVLFSDRSLFKMASRRLKNKKLTFYFSERWWKPPVGKWRLLHPKFIYFAFRLKSFSRNVNFHYLAQGAYASFDFQTFGNLKGKIWNWGYFTDVSKNITTINPIIKKKEGIINILWCGRLLKWKRVDTIIKAFSILIKEYNQCHLTIIGDGSEKANLLDLANKTLPVWSFEFVPSQPRQIIREAMHDSDIYVLSSSGYEGWGAVINEAMAEGCVVIASIESGGGKALISDMGNGILFSSANYQQLSHKLTTLIKDQELVLKLKENGIRTIKELWSPEIAADRFLKVCNALLTRTSIPIYEYGPMKLENDPEL